MVVVVVFVVVVDIDIVGFVAPLARGAKCRKTKKKKNKEWGNGRGGVVFGGWDRDAGNFFV